ncbi:MAG: NAD(P)-dependent oxidoreductase [Candidatus Heimdallarchaeaceae archaeon]|jgi:D-3-phosphoglycerate dehydrogenase
MKAYITAEFSPEALDELKDILKDEIVYESWRTTNNLFFKDEDLIQKIKEIGAEVFICEGDNVKKAVIEQVDLKIIGSTRGDPNNIDIDTATDKGIPVLFAPDRNTVSVAELTIGLILALARKLHSVERILHSEKEFEVNEFEDYIKYYNLFKGFELKGKTVGIVGLGRIGFSVAKLLLPFKVNFLVYDPYVDQVRLDAINGESVELETLLSDSDIITLHCPPTDETDDMIGEEQINLMQSHALFINTARASIIDEYALLDALKEKKIAGAALDVFSIEPVDQDNEFLELDNVIVTPHIGGDTFDTNHRHSMLMVNGIKQILNNQIPDNVKNPEVLKGYTYVETQVEKKDFEDIEISLQNYARQGQQIINICNEMISKGFIIGTAGNASARVKLPNGQDAYLVTPSTVQYENMQIEDLVLIDEEGVTIAGTRNPTSERRLHQAIYQGREDIKAIIHSHAPFSTALSIARIPIGPIVDEVIPFIGGCEVAEFGMAGTDDLANNAVEALGDNLAVFIANHGNVGCGANLGQAWTVCQQVEMAAKIQYRAALLGTIYAIPEEAEEAEKEMFEIMKDLNFD